MSKFNEVWSALHDGVIESTKGKKHCNAPYSKSKEQSLTLALLNTPDYEETIIKTKAGEPTEEKIHPVKDFRDQFVTKILRDNGIDKEQAEEAGNTYQFSGNQAAALDGLCREKVEQFLRTGNSWDFSKKKDFNGSIKLREVPERIVKGRVPGTGVETTTKEDRHLVIVKKSGTPKYCKTKIE